MTLDDDALIAALRSALAGPVVVLDVPRRLRARWAVEHVIDAGCCWLVAHRCWPVAVAVWKLLGLW